MRSDELAQRWLAPDLGRLWEVATALGVRPDGSDAATLRLELPGPAHFAAGQYYLVRMRVDAAPKAVEQAYSVSSSPWPPNSEIEIIVRGVPSGRVSSRTHPAGGRRRPTPPARKLGHSHVERSRRRSVRDDRCKQRRRADGVHYEVRLSPPVDGADGTALFE